MKGTTIYSRGELLDWVNSLLGLDYVKIEQCANGAAFCQITDCLYRGSVKLRGVNFDATSETEMLANYKILQAAFQKKNIEKPIPVDQLLKKSYQSTLEMLQWFRGFFDQNFTGGEYNGPARREECKKRVGRASGAPPKTPARPGSRAPAKTPAPSNQTRPRVSHNTSVLVSDSRPMPAKTPARPTNHAPPVSARKPPARTPARSSSTIARESTIRKASPSAQRSFSNIKSIRQQKEEEEKLQEEIRNLKEKLGVIQEENQEVLDERNFYYQKLQKVEELCNAQEDPNNFITSIQAVLYEAPAEDGAQLDDDQPDELEI